MTKVIPFGTRAPEFRPNTCVRGGYLSARMLAVRQLLLYVLLYHTAPCTLWIRSTHPSVRVCAVYLDLTKEKTEETVKLNHDRLHGTHFPTVVASQGVLSALLCSLRHPLAYHLLALEFGGLSTLLVAARWLIVGFLFVLVCALPSLPLSECDRVVVGRI